MGQGGQLTEPLTEAQLVDILEKISDSKKETKITVKLLCPRSNCDLSLSFLSLFAREEIAMMTGKVAGKISNAFSFLRNRMNWSISWLYNTNLKQFE